MSNSPRPTNALGGVGVDNTDSDDIATSQPPPSSDTIVGILCAHLTPNNPAYLYVGNDALLALNPSPEPNDGLSTRYLDQAKTLWDSTSENSDMPLEAHPYQMAAMAFYRMLRDSQNQSVVFR